MKTKNFIKLTGLITTNIYTLLLLCSYFPFLHTHNIKSNHIECQLCSNVSLQINYDIFYKNKDECSTHHICMICLWQYFLKSVSHQNMKILAGFEVSIYLILIIQSLLPFRKIYVESFSPRSPPEIM